MSLAIDLKNEIPNQETDSLRANAHGALTAPAGEAVDFAASNYSVLSGLSIVFCNQEKSHQAIALVYRSPWL